MNEISKKKKSVKERFISSIPGTYSSMEMFGYYFFILSFSAVCLQLLLNAEKETCTDGLYNLASHVEPEAFCEAS